MRQNALGIPKLQNHLSSPGVHEMSQSVARLALESLETRYCPALAAVPPVAISGLGNASESSQVQIVDSQTRASLAVITPFPGFAGELSVSVADLTGDNIADLVVGAGSGAQPRVMAYDGTSLSSGTPVVLANFFAFSEGFAGGVSVAILPSGSSGVPGTIAVGAGPGAGPHVRTFTPNGVPASGPLSSFYAFAPEFDGGVHVAAGQLNSDSIADLIVGSGTGANGHVIAFSGSDASILTSYFVFSGGFNDEIAASAASVTDAVSIRSVLTNEIITTFFAGSETSAMGASLTFRQTPGFPMADILFAATSVGTLQYSGSVFGDETFVITPFETDFAVG
jgi:hypothetical protein